jgi:opacity protein-like surface antigen
VTRIGLGILAACVLATPAGAQPGPDARIDIGLSGGLALTRVDGTSPYSDTWSYAWLSTVTERTTISAASKAAFSLGGDVTYYVTPRLGIQLAAGFISSDTPTSAVGEMSWTWVPLISGTTFTKSATWSGTGSLRAMPLSVNLVGRFGPGRARGFLSAGPTLFLNTFEATSLVAYGVSTNAGVEQFIDAIPVPAAIPRTSWGKVGANVGGGFIYQLSPMLALTMEARYFLCGRKSLSWELTPGRYDGYFYKVIKAFDFTQADADDVSNGKLQAFEVNPSHLRIAVGLRLALGGR